MSQSQISVRDAMGTLAFQAVSGVLLPVASGVLATSTLSPGALSGILGGRWAAFYTPTRRTRRGEGQPRGAN